MLRGLPLSRSNIAMIKHDAWGNLQQVGASATIKAPLSFLSHYQLSFGRQCECVTSNSNLNYIQTPFAISLCTKHGVDCTCRFGVIFCNLMFKIGYHITEHNDLNMTGSQMRVRAILYTFPHSNNTLQPVITSLGRELFQAASQLIIILTVAEFQPLGGGGWLQGPKCQLAQIWLPDLGHVLCQLMWAGNLLNLAYPISLKVSIKLL